jgi:23S rRNA pseudouridine2605 synthase
MNKQSGRNANGKKRAFDNKNSSTSRKPAAKKSTTSYKKDDSRPTKRFDKAARDTKPYESASRPPYKTASKSTGNKRTFGEKKEDSGFGNKPEKRIFTDKPERRTHGKNKEGKTFAKPAEKKRYNDKSEKPNFGEKREEKGYGKKSPRRTYNKKNDFNSFEKKPDRINTREKGSESSPSSKPRRLNKFAARASGKPYTKREDRNIIDRADAKTYITRSAKNSDKITDVLEKGNVRLNKYISNAGICSRREADKLIGAGLVSVNGVVVTEMGYQVKPGEQVKYNGEKLSTDKKVYLVINKPKDVICTLDDPEGRKIVTDLIDEPGLPRVYPVGRLDRNTTGILLITNDGELSQRLMHPKFQVQKIYKASLNKNFSGEHLWELTNGIELEDGPIKVDSIAMPDATDKKEVVVEIHSGRNRIIHRIFEHLGYKVERLDRVWYAGFDKRGLKRGEWRHLGDRELNNLKKLVKLG